MKTFEEWLQDGFEPDGVLDDDMPDAFDSWISNLEGEELIEYAEDYGKEMYLRGEREGIILGGMVGTTETINQLKK